MLYLQHKDGVCVKQNKGAMFTTMMEYVTKQQQPTVQLINGFLEENSAEESALTGCGYTDNTQGSLLGLILSLGFFLIRQT